MEREVLPVITDTHSSSLGYKPQLLNDLYYHPRLATCMARLYCMPFGLLVVLAIQALSFSLYDNVHSYVFRGEFRYYLYDHASATFIARKLQMYSNLTTDQKQLMMRTSINKQKHKIHLCDAQNLVDYYS